MKLKVVGWCGFMADADIQSTTHVTGWKYGAFQELERIYQRQCAPRMHSASRVRYSNRLVSRHRRDSISDTADNMRQLSVKK